MESARVPVLVTTEHRGVFFGYAESSSLSEKTLTLTNCRNCIYWDASIGGFLGLAAAGPNGKCRIGKPAPEVMLHGVTSVSHCTEEAAKAWEAA